jgi:beta-N-acetylhexosaminidase
MMNSPAVGAALGVVIGGFDGTEPPGHLLADLSRGLGGVVLFQRNVLEPCQVAALLDHCRRAANGRSVIAAVDQEGGRVARLKEPLTVLPPARTLGRFEDPSLTEMAGRLVGAELRAVGFTADFAPVLDVDTNPASPVIGDRSFSGDPIEVIRHGLAFARGLRDAGVHPVAKHFPGHGDTRLDSHMDLPRVDWDQGRLEAVEVRPFEAYARAGMGGIMTAHVLYTALDPQAPATVSRAIVQGLLRDKLRWRGPVVSDDLEMGAISRYASPEQAAVQAIDAGVDGLLVCRSREVRDAVVEELSRQAQRRPAFHRRLERAAGRLASLASPLPCGPLFSWIGSEDHLARQQKLARALSTGHAP